MRVCVMDRAILSGDSRTQFELSDWYIRLYGQDVGMARYDNEGGYLGSDPPGTFFALCAYIMGPVVDKPD